MLNWFLESGKKPAKILIADEFLADLLEAKFDKAGFDAEHEPGLIPNFAMMSMMMSGMMGGEEEG
jgi:hypothetical protein